MSENKNQPIAKVLLLCIAIFGAFAAFFAGLIALTSSASFLVVFGWIMAVVVAIMIPTLLWGYVIEPLWWAKLSDKTQEKTRNWGIGLFLLCILILYPLGMFGGDTWSGEGQVNLFPEGASSKNYRLTAEIEVTTKLWWNRDYKIDSVEWPNSGTSDLTDCTISKSNNSCSDEEGRNWRIEVVEAPDHPSRDD